MKKEESGSTQGIAKDGIDWYRIYREQCGLAWLAVLIFFVCDLKGIFQKILEE